MVVCDTLETNPSGKIKDVTSAVPPLTFVETPADVAYVAIPEFVEYVETPAIVAYVLIPDDVE